MKEIWKDVTGYTHAYQISNKGKIRTKCRLSKKYQDSDRQHIIASRIRKPSLKNGYPFCWLYAENGQRKMQYVHRLVALAFLNREKNKTYIDHIDGNRQNNSVNNLRWCTQSQNLKNRASRGYYFHKQNKRYCARIKIEGKSISLGCYTDEKKAKDVYQAALRKALAA